MDGSIGILNVGAGDTKLTFDPEKPEERKRAAAAVTEMLRLGFAILVQVGEKGGKPLFTRADAFDPKTCEYIIIGTPPEEIDIPGAKAEQAAKPRTSLDDGPSLKRGRGRTPKVRIPAQSTRAVSVARSAGG